MKQGSWCQFCDILQVLSERSILNLWMHQHFVKSRKILEGDNFSPVDRRFFCRSGIGAASDDPISIEWRDWIPPDVTDESNKGRKTISSRVYAQVFGRCMLPCKLGTIRGGAGLCMRYPGGHQPLIGIVSTLNELFVCARMDGAIRLCFPMISASPFEIVSENKTRTYGWRRKSFSIGLNA